MLQQQRQKRDILSFFQPYQRQLPQKRPASDLEDDEHSNTVHPVSSASPPRTPTRSSQSRGTETSELFKTPKSHKTSPLKTPRSDRTVSIPFRTPTHDRLDSLSASQKKAISEEANALRFSPSNYAFSFEFPDSVAPTSRYGTDENTTEIRDSQDDETSSLESLADIFDRNQKNDTTSDSSPPEEGEGKKQVQRPALNRPFSGRRAAPIVGKQKLRELLAKGRENKFDFARTLDDHFEDQEVEESIAHARKKYESSTQEHESGLQTELDKDLLVSMVQNEGDGTDNVSRLLNAVDRTEALSKEKSFSFFLSGDGIHHTDKASVMPKLPQNAIPAALWASQDSETQRRAFLSGIFADLAAMGSLSDEAVRWIFENIARETRDDLQRAYIRCVEAASPHWTRTNLTVSDINLLFRNLNADSDALSDTKQIEPRYQSLTKPPQWNERALISVLELLHLLCRDMDFAVLSRLCSVTTRLSLDSKVMNDARSAHAVEELLGKLCNLPDSQSRWYVHERITSDLSQNLHAPTLQAKFLSHVLPLSQPANSLRTLLARSFLLGLQKNVVESSSILTRLTDHIATSPHFSIASRPRSDNVDYVLLSSRIQVLDVAIANGCRPESFVTLQEESEFNASVDKLVDCLHEIFISIADTGASHMRRTEAKDALQALEYRVLYSVRTKPRRKRHVFDSDTGRARDAGEYENEVKSKDFMAKFLKR